MQNEAEAVEAVASAMCEADGGHFPDKYRTMAQAALAAARAAHFEEAAGIARNELAMVVGLNAEIAHPQWLAGLDDAAAIVRDAIRTSGGAQ